MIVDIYRHAGHADILRGLIDGAVGADRRWSILPPGDEAWWKTYRSKVEDAALQAGGAPSRRIGAHHPRQHCAALALGFKGQCRTLGWSDFGCHRSCHQWARTRRYWADSVGPDGLRAARFRDWVVLGGTGRTVVKLLITRRSWVQIPPPPPSQPVQRPRFGGASAGRHLFYRVEAGRRKNDCDDSGGWVRVRQPDESSEKHARACMRYRFRTGIMRSPLPNAGETRHEV